MARKILRDQDWKKIEFLLPSQQGKQGRPRKDDRLMIEGILWILRTGAPWRDLPEGQVHDSIPAIELVKAFL